MNAGILLFLSLYAFFTDGGAIAAVFLFIVSCLVSLLNASRKTSKFAFHDIDSAEYKHVYDIDCLENAAMYVVPMILNPIAVIIINEGLVAPMTVEKLFSSCVAFGTLLFACSVVSLCVYRQMVNNLHWHNAKRYVAMIVALLVTVAICFLVVYFGFNPIIPNQNIVIGATVIAIVLPVLGMKGVLIPYAIENTYLYGTLFSCSKFILCFIFEALVKMYKGGLSGIVEWIRSFIKLLSKHAISLSLGTMFLLGTGLMIALILTFRPL